MLNPREVSYSVPELIELLAAVGLELVFPAVPNLWNLRDILPEPAYERFLELPKGKQLEIGDILLTRYFGSRRSE